MSQFLSDSEKTILALKSQGLNFSQISKKVNLTATRVAVKFRKAVKKHFLLLNNITRHTPISETLLSSRIKNRISFLNEEVTTLGDLENYTEKDLLNMRNLGPTSVEEIKKYISTFGISLKIEIKEEPIKTEKIKYSIWKEQGIRGMYIPFTEDELLQMIDVLNFTSTFSDLRDKLQDILDDWETIKERK